MALDHRTGGVALLVGYGLLLAALFRDPASGLATATSSAQGVVFFLVLPIIGLSSGGYVFRNLPFRTTVAFLTGTYLAIAGIALLLLSSPLLVTLLGAGLFSLAVVALVAPVTAAAGALFPETALLTEQF